MLTSIQVFVAGTPSWNGLSLGMTMIGPQLPDALGSLDCGAFR